MYAAREGHVGLVRWLLDHGAAINQWNIHRWTPYGVRRFTVASPM
jgi:hypothetical protein